MNFSQKNIFVTFLFILFIPSITLSKEENFNLWLNKLKDEAIEKGISKETVIKTINKIEILPNIINKDRQQPEFIDNFSDYITRNVSNRKVRIGKNLLKDHKNLLNRLEKQFGVPERYLIAFWGIETNFGSYTGNYLVVNSLATLAFDPRRRNFFRNELLGAIKILDQKHTSFDKYKGSWAGASGQMQFMPSTFLEYAIDYSNDGKKDIWTNLPDSFASAANYLSQIGWEKDYIWGREVKLPKGFDYFDAQLGTSKSVNHWRIKGVKKANNTSLPESTIMGSIILPSGKDGPAFLVYKNFEKIMQWNRSIFYSLTVGYFSDRLINISQLDISSLKERKLSIKKILELQKKLNFLGYGNLNEDGIMGTNTKHAIRLFQRQNKLSADGYADKKTVDFIKLSSKSYINTNIEY